VELIKFECDQQPICLVNVLATDDPTFAPTCLRVFSAPLLVSTGGSAGTMSVPREAISIMLNQQVEDGASVLAAPSVILRKGLEHLEANAALLCTDGLSFLYL
jgi:hypothetical protein